MSLVIIGSILTIMGHTILNICVLVAVTIVLTWKVYSRFCLKFGLLVLCIYQNLYHTNMLGDSSHESHPINFAIYVALPTLAAVHITVFDVKDCILIMVYSIIYLMFDASLLQAFHIWSILLSIPYFEERYREMCSVLDVI
eukprot:78445_1